MGAVTTRLCMSHASATFPGNVSTFTTTTNSSGAYSFTTDSNGNQLRPGTYTITETLPGGYLTDAATVGTVNGSADGSVVSTTASGRRRSSARSTRRCFSTSAARSHTTPC